MSLSGLRAVVVPHPPLLAAELTGPGSESAARLRAACEAAVTDLLGCDRPDLIVIGPGGVTRRHPDHAWGTLAGYGVAVSAPARPNSVANCAANSVPNSAANSADVAGRDGPPGLPLSLTIGCLLIDRAASGSVVGVRELREVAVDDGPDPCRRLGAELAVRRPDAAWLVLGDSAARHTRGAPGASDPRALPFDAEVEAAFAAGEPARLLALDPVLSAALGAEGRAAWQVLAGAWQVWAGGRAAVARVDYADAPFGVGYLVVRWSDPA